MAEQEHAKTDQEDSKGIPKGSKKITSGSQMDSTSNYKVIATGAPSRFQRDSNRIPEEFQNGFQKDSEKHSKGNPKRADEQMRQGLYS